MNRKCKCKICKRVLNSQEAFVMYVKGKPQYYCNEQEYDKSKKEWADWCNLFEYVKTEVLQYEPQMIFPSYLIKELKEIGRAYPYEVILDTFKAKKYALDTTNANKVFPNEQRKISYIMAIIKANINDQYKTYKLLKKQEQKIQTVLKDDQTNLVLAMEDSNRPQQKPQKSLEAFLDEEDL